MMPPNRSRNRKGKGSATPYTRPATTIVKQEEVASGNPPTSTQTAVPGPSGVNNELVNDALSYFR